MSLSAQSACQNLDNQFVDTADLMVRCYDALIRDFNDGKEAYYGGEKEVLLDKVRHAQDIITELLIGLDYERGGEIAQNLGRIYNYLLRELIGIQDSKAVGTLEHLARIVGDLREAWVQVSQQTAHA